MPTTAQVKVNTVNHTSQTSSAGNELNYIEITGFNATTSKGFKKRFFATKKDGTATKNAETADTLKQDDWIEIVMDDTSYQNVQTLKKISEPAGMSAPSQAGGGQSSGGGGGKGGGDKMSKAEWAEKDRKKEASIHRQSALKAAVGFLAGKAKAKASDVVDVAESFFDFLQTDNKQPCAEQDVKETPVKEKPTNTVIPEVVEDDDIPF